VSAPLHHRSGFGRLLAAFRPSADLGGMRRRIYIADLMTDADTSRDGDQGPLAGQRIVVTRPPGQADSFARRLRELGAKPVACPTIRIVLPEDPEPLKRAARELGSYDWVVFTSVNGVDRLAEALEDEGRSPEEALPAGARVAAIGPSTAGRARERFGVEPEVVPDEYRAEALVRAIRRAAARGNPPPEWPEEESGGQGGRELEGQRMLLPRAAEARAVLPDSLEAAGATVDEVAAYRAVAPDDEVLASVRERLRAGEIDWLTFTASSTVRNFVSAVGTEVGGARVAAIGPITAGTARELGLDVDVVAEEYTIPGLIQAMIRARSGNGREAA